MTEKYTPHTPIDVDDSAEQPLSHSPYETGLRQAWARYRVADLNPQGVAHVERELELFRLFQRTAFASAVRGIDRGAGIVPEDSIVNVWYEPVSLDDAPGEQLQLVESFVTKAGRDGRRLVLPTILRSTEVDGVLELKERASLKEVPRLDFLVGAELVVDDFFLERVQSFEDFITNPQPTPEQLDSLRQSQHEQAAFGHMLQTMVALMPGDLPSTYSGRLQEFMPQMPSLLN